MGDLLDRAQDEIDFRVAAQIKNSQSAFANRELAVKGYCHYCDDILENPMALFCCPECSADWEHEQAAKRRNANL